MGTGETDISLIKLAKNPRLIIRMNTRPGVRDGKPELLALIRVGKTRRDSNAALIGKFHRVANQIEQDLPDSTGIPDNDSRHCGINSETQHKPFLRCGL